MSSLLRMPFVLAIAASAAWQLPGCFIVDDADRYCGDGVLGDSEACDDGNAKSADGCSSACALEVGSPLQVQWAIKTAGTDGACPAGFDTARIIARPSALPLTDQSADVIDIFACADKSGTTGFLLSGQYEVWLEITNGDGSAVYAQSPTQLINVGAMSTSVSFEIHTDRGFFLVGWALQRGGETRSCEQEPAVTNILANFVATAQPATSTAMFTCSQASGYSSALQAGTYQVRVAATTRELTTIGAPAAFADREISGPNQITNLGTGLIVLDAVSPTAR